MRTNSVLLFLLLLLVTCTPEPRPRPMGQMRLALPAHDYEEVSTSCPYTLELPSYAMIRERSVNDSSCWSDILFPSQRATIHLTYRSVNGNLAKLLDESIGLTYEHHILADNIENKTVIDPESRVYGTVSRVYGNVASNVQFYVTDSTSHFLRGALYFNTRPNKDSLLPVVDHLSVDIEHLISNLEWKDRIRP